MRPILPAFTLALATLGAAQSTTSVFQTYGRGCSHPLNPNPPALYSAKGPVIGKPFLWEVRNCPANTLGLMVVGGSNQTWQTVPLPLPLAFHDMPNCTMFCSPDLLFYLPTGTGTAKATVGIPQQVSLVKLTFYMQFYVPDASANKRGVSTSDAAIVVVGDK